VTSSYDTGLPAIYAALKYGIPTYGIEYDPKLVELAKDFARKAGVQDLVSFEVKDIVRWTLVGTSGTASRMSTATTWSSSRTAGIGCSRC
jgi:hypothetical protein